MKNENYEISTISSLMNKSTGTVPSANGYSLFEKNIFNILIDSTWGIKSFLFVLFLAGTIIGIFRFVFLVTFATKQRRKYVKNTYDDNFNPSVSIVIAAYNEEKVICETISSLLESDYKHLEIVVVDDGSNDNTFGVVKTVFANNRKVRIIRKPNGGKASAVNLGFRVAWGEIVVVIDADTVIAKDAVSLLARHFKDENIAAVAGNVKVGNKNKLLTKWQHIEYVTGLNLERRAFDYLNCITVVPGAIGAWRRNVIINAGLYSEDTLAEDADITLKVLKQGYKIVYEEGARAFTEAPEDIKSFLKQRLRWSYGTLQCLWKHRDAVLNPKYKSLGFAALPNMWLYQLIFQIFSPLTEVLFLLGLMGSNPKETIITYLVFFAIDLIVTLYAFSLEKENPRPLVLLIIQRLVYRQLMTYVVYKSIIASLKGVKISWNKLVRNGNVKMNKA